MESLFKAKRDRKSGKIERESRLGDKTLQCVNALSWLSRLVAYHDGKLEQGCRTSGPRDTGTWSTMESLIGTKTQKAWL